jgi:hypothetical protein
MLASACCIDRPSYLTALQTKIARLEHFAGTSNESNSFTIRPMSPPFSVDEAQYNTRRTCPRSSLTGHNPEQTAHPDNNIVEGLSPQDETVNSNCPDFVSPLSITAAPKYMSSSKGLKCKSPRSLFSILDEAYYTQPTLDLRLIGLSMDVY